MPSLLSGINVALQALMANQTAIQVIEHNVANANTVGYHRQEAVLRAGQSYSPVGLYAHDPVAGQFGTGVTVDTIRRFNLEFFDARYRQEVAGQSYWGSQSQALTQVESSLAETGSSSLLTKLDQFWAGWQALSTDPDNNVARADLKARSQELVSAINQRAASLIDLRQDQDRLIVQHVDEINTLAGQVARLNQEITKVMGAGDQPNDLLDQRDLILERLAESSGAVTHIQENGEALVSIDGHALVVSGTAFALSGVPDPANDDLAQLTWSDGMLLKKAGGELGGLLEVRDTVIPTQQSGLDQIAAAVIDRVNTVHQQGYGINNSHNLDFFTGTDALSMRMSSNIDDLANIAAASNPDAPGDGSNADQLANIQNELLMGGNLNLTDYYSTQVANLGSTIKHAQNESDSHKLVADSLQQQHEAETGVSLDEEAVNLVKYQRAYQAAARLMTVMDEMIDRVVNGMGRVGL